jgi:glycosyltransferase involved in cell wall biosynthesis
MRAARALVIPSRWPEGQPLVMLEALAAGLPVIGSDIGGIGEVLADADPRTRVPLDDALAWGDALRALADDSLVDALGLQARELYERRFSPAVGLEAQLAVYERALERRARRSG